MQVMVQSDTGLKPFNEAQSVYVNEDGNNLVINQGSEEKMIMGEIVNVSHADIVSIADYYGNAVSRISGEDIHAINEEIVSLYCEEAMQVSNRVNIELRSGSSVEINGQIVACELIN